MPARAGHVIGKFKPLVSEQIHAAGNTRGIGFFEVGLESFEVGLGFLEVG